MCGINGVINLLKGNTGFRRSVENMNTVINHRGPDHQDVFLHNNVALGHVRLSIIDLSEQAHQPMKSHSGRYVLVFNGEIYNFRALKKELSDYPFQSNSDTEVVLAAYEKWGHNFLEKLQGMFALALYDQKSDHVLLARDRNGIKPLYYAKVNEKLIFSSEINGIFASGFLKRKIKETSLIDYLRYQTVHTPNALFEDVQMLAPGQLMNISEGKVEQQYYHRYQYNPTSAPADYATAKDEVNQRVRQAISDRLVSDVPMGCFLSGGIDSSIITAVGAQQAKQKLNTFSVVFDEAQFSEKPFIEEVVKRYDTNHNYLQLSADDFLKSIPQALYAMDHPSGDGPNTYVIAEATKKAGVTMALSGLGSDELFGGYPVFGQIPALLSKKWLTNLPVSLRSIAADLMSLASSNNISTQKKLAILKAQKLDLASIYPYSRQILMDPIIQKITHSKGLAENAITSLISEMRAHTKKDAFPLLSQISIAEMNTYMQNTLLRDADQMGMAHALEIRVPFLDHRLVDYVLQLPDQFKKGQYDKHILVDAFKNDLPDSIYQRKKMGFVLPYDQWMRNELKKFCTQNLMALERHPLFKVDQVMELWKHFLNNSQGISWSRIWGLVVLGYKLEQWKYEEKS